MEKRQRHPAAIDFGKKLIHSCLCSIPRT